MTNSGGGGLRAFLNRVQSWTKGQRGEVTTLNSVANAIDWDLEDSNHFEHAATENSTLNFPSNAVKGQSGRITYRQHASTPFTLAYAAGIVFVNKTAPTVTAVAGSTDIFDYYVMSNTEVILTFGPDVG